MPIIRQAPLHVNITEKMRKPIEDKITWIKASFISDDAVFYREQCKFEQQ